MFWVHGQEILSRTWQWFLFVSENLAIWQFLLALPCLDITIIRCCVKVVFVLWNWSSLELLIYVFYLSEYVLHSCPVLDINWRHCFFYIIFKIFAQFLRPVRFFLLKIKFHAFGLGKNSYRVCPVCDKKISTSEFAFKWLCWCIL